MSISTDPTGPPRRLPRRALLGGAAAVIAGLGGGTAWAVDRFLIEHAEVATASGLWSASTPTPSAAAGAEVAVTTHTSGSGSARVTWYVADIRLPATESLLTAFAEDTFGENIIEKPSVIADENGAGFAINGDYYGFRDTGIVIRNGVAFRDRGTRQGLALDRSGSLFTYDETATNAATMVKGGAWQAWSFGPTLVEDGSVVAGIDAVEVDTNVGNHSIQGQQPRTGLGMIAPRHLVAIVVDGRSPGYSRGVTMTEFAAIFSGLGAVLAYNLDGGGSSTMVLDGTLVNNPLGRGRERGTSDIIYVRG